MPEDVMEYRVVGLILGGFEVSADTEWMSANRIIKLLNNDLITQYPAQYSALDTGKVILNEVCSAKIEKRMVKCSKS